MRLMDRYILKEHLMMVAYCLAGFTMIYVLLDLFNFMGKFIDARTPLLVIAQYYLYWLLPFLQYIIPASLLFATLYTLWHLSRNSELTAMRASGVSFWRIMVPFLGTGFFFSVLTAVIQEAFLPQTSAWVEQFRGNTLDKKKGAATQKVPVQYLDTRSCQMWEIEKFNPDHPRHLKGVKIRLERPNGTALRQITASRGEFLDGAWWMFDAVIQDYQDDRLSLPKGPPCILSPEGVELSYLSATPADLASDLRPWTSLSTAQMARLLSAHPDRPGQAERSVFFHARFALPWASLVATLLAIPVGARNSRQNMLAGIFLALACFLAFYATIQVGLFLARVHIIWPWLGAWLSNIVFLSAGLIMARKLS
jgi:lipopolysaccharide export system permease protein